MTNVRGKYTQVQRLAPGTVFQLGGSATETLQWKMVRIAAGVAYVERLNDNQTRKIQKVNPELMVYAIFPEETEMTEPTVELCPKCKQAVTRVYMGERICSLCSHKSPTTSLLATPGRDLGDGGFLNIPPRKKGTDA